MLGTNAIARNDVHDHPSRDAELDDRVRVEANAMSKQWQLCSDLEWNAPSREFAGEGADVNVPHAAGTQPAKDQLGATDDDGNELLFFGVFVGRGRYLHVLDSAVARPRLRE